MKITKETLVVLTNRLKVGNRRGIHLNALPFRSRYKLDLKTLAHIDPSLPEKFVQGLTSASTFVFKVSPQDCQKDINLLSQEEKKKLDHPFRLLNSILNQAEAIESEKGVNTFGFGFPLVVRRDLKDGQLTVAPLIIWNLKIRKGKELDSFVISRNEEDTFQVNEVLINHILADTDGKEIEQLSADLLINGYIKISEIIDVCDSLLQITNTTYSPDVKSALYKGSSTVESIADKRTLETHLIGNNSKINFAGIFSLFELQKQNVIKEYDTILDQMEVDIPINEGFNALFQPISGVKTDPSQQSILNSLQSTRNVVIQGPPGTGKSQTLTAVLVNALESNKKVLVVCEKRTALEVLENNLADRGHKRQCILIKDLSKDRKTVVEAVRDRLDSASHMANQYTRRSDEMTKAVSSTTNKITVINKKLKSSTEKLLGNLTRKEVIAEYLKALKNIHSKEVIELPKQYFNITYDDFRRIQAFLDDAEKRHHALSSTENVEFSIKLNKFKESNFLVLENQIKSDFKHYEQEFNRILSIKDDALDEYIKSRKSQHASLIKSIEKSENIIKIALQQLVASIQVFKDEYRSHNEDLFSKNAKEVTKIGNDISDILSHYKGKEYLLSPIMIDSLVFKIQKYFSGSAKKISYDYSVLLDLVEKMNNVIKSTVLLPKKDFKPQFSTFQSDYKEYINFLYQRKSNIRDSYEREFDELFGLKQFDLIPLEGLVIEIRKKEYLLIDPFHKANLSKFLASTSNLIKEIATAYNQLVETSRKSEDIKVEFSKKLTIVNLTADIEKISECVRKLKSNSNDIIIDEYKRMQTVHATAYMPLYGELTTRFKNLRTKVREDNWVIFSQDNLFPDFIEKFSELINDWEAYQQHPVDLLRVEYNWHNLYLNSSESLKVLLDLYATTKKWADFFTVSYLNNQLINSSSDDNFIEDGEISSLSTDLNHFELVQKRFINELQLYRESLAIKQFQQQNYSLTIENLYNKRSSSKFKRQSLRQIVKKDKELFTAFFPIVLTTPDIACNLFSGLNGYFDLVVFDEASQLRLADNFPALLKGKQIIISGDEHQMPPSTYFEKIYDGVIDGEDDVEEDDEDDLIQKDGILSAESLLDFAANIGFSKRSLTYHYRSKHPALIDFSNAAFYKTLKPTPAQREYTPITLVSVNGTFHERVNIAEAHAVLSILKNNIERFEDGKYPSIGVATFNVNQRDYIIRLLSEERAEDRVFGDKMMELEANGFFVKNLENIQGDERDVIIISTTYGKDSQGKFALRGLMTRSKSYRLLNVIITRAKYKVYCCTSIPDEKYQAYANYFQNDSGIDRTGAFYAYLSYCKAVSEGDLIWQDAILSDLRRWSKADDKGEAGIEKNNMLESPFEEEVYAMLVGTGVKESCIVPQYQKAGYRIDMVYKSEKPNVPLIAIECDGAEYHSTHEAYLHDKHREDILTDYGFVFYRIWSTNWWRNPERETLKLKSFIEEIENKSIGKQVILNKEYDAVFKNTVEIEPIQIDKVIASEQVKLEQSRVSESKYTNQIIDDFKDIVEDRDTVKVHYLKLNKELIFQLVYYKSGTSVAKLENGVGRIYYRAPLAQALIGRKVGDTVIVPEQKVEVKIIAVEKFKPES